MTNKYSDPNPLESYNDDLHEEKEKWLSLGKASIQV
jgi:hypothetical protein